MTVALVERNLFGGTCVNTGCMPTKTLVASARAAHLARRAADYGVVLEGPVRVDMARIKARAEAVVVHARKGIESMLAGMEGCTVFRGHARFESPTTVRVADEVLSRRAHLRQRRRPRARAEDAGRRERPVSHQHVDGGAGHVAPSSRRWSAGATSASNSPRCIDGSGARSRSSSKAPASSVARTTTCSAAVKEILEREGIKVRLEAECIAFDPPRVRDEVTVRLECASEERPVSGSHVLLAVGRQPNTEDLGLDRAGVAVDARGYIVVDDELRTNVKGIWALGDCNGKGAFTHTAYNDFEIVASNVLDDDPRRLSDRIEAYALYIDPALGRAGLTEAAARKTGRPLLVAKRPMSSVGRASRRPRHRAS